MYVLHNDIHIFNTCMNNYMYSYTNNNIIILIIVQIHILNGLYIL